MKKTVEAFTPLKRALSYAAKGWLVVPMHTAQDGKCSCHRGANCQNAGKHPMTPHGVKDATINRKTIKSWWDATPLANIGIATGRKSEIVVLDIDPRNGGVETLRTLEDELGALPNTVTSKTGGGGTHLVFAYPERAIRKDSAGKLLGPGVDVLSDGAIMVTPPSRHEAGKQYKWENQKSFRDLKPGVLPDKWLATMTGATKATTVKAGTGTIPEGERNTALTSLAGTMQHSGVSAKAILAALLAENKAICSPPLAKTEVKKIAKSVSRYAPLSGRDHSDDAEKLVQAVLTDHFGGGKHLTFGADGSFWHYTGKFWSRVPDRWIDGRILDSIKKSGLRTQQKSASLIKQARLLLEAQLAVKGDPFAFVGDPPRVINCTNCEVWIGDDGTIDLRPHRPESHLRQLLNVSYDPEAKCPEYDKALLEIFSKSKKPNVLRRHWHELVGYLIQPRRNIPVIAVLLGPGANGKTVLARTVVKLIGPAQVHAQRVEELDKNRFALGSLLGKLVFLDDDVRAGARLPDGTLKMISEAKEVTGEIKYKPSFSFVVRTVPVLLCNNVPSLADVSHDRKRLGPIIKHTGPMSIRDLPLDRIDQFAIDNAADDLFPNATPQTKNREFYTPVAAVIHRAGVERRIKRPVGWKGTSSTSWLEPQQAFRLFAEADAIDREFGLLVRFLIYTGLRLGEALNARLRDLHLEDRTLYVPDTKTRTPRPVYIPPVIVDALMAQTPRPARPKAAKGRRLKNGLAGRSQADAGKPFLKRGPDAKLFRFHASGRLRGMLARALKQARLSFPPRQGGFHLFCHTYGTWMHHYGKLDTFGLVRTNRWKHPDSADRYRHTKVSEEARRADLLPIAKGNSTSASSKTQR